MAAAVVSPPPLLRVPVGDLTDYIDMDGVDPAKFGTALGIIRNNDKVALNDVDSDEEVTIDIDTLDVRAL